MNLLVLGAAVSGRAAARLGRRLGHDVTVYDADPSAVAAPEADGYAVRGGDWDPSWLEGADAVVTSPGIPPAAEPVRDALGSGKPLWSEMEFAARHLRVPYAAITGTNGKTTTTAAATDMLRAGGVDAAAAGNIGTALSDLVGTAHDVIVVEASSFQLRFVDEFHPVAAAVLNVAPDHLDWHGDLGRYRAAKARIFEQQSPRDVLAYDVDDPGAVSLVAAAAARCIPVSGSRRPDGGNGPDGDHLVIGNARYPRPPLDPAFLVDLATAATLAHHLGATPDGVGTVLAGFEPADHRRAAVGSWDGVSWVDDSKATNPHAAAASASAYPSVVLIAGGRNKGLDLSALAAVRSVRAIVAVGEASDELAAVTDPERFVAAGDLRGAVIAADAIARPGDVVLLAPGCASFDMFTSYAERGEVFTTLVRSLKETGDGV